MVIWYLVATAAYEYAVSGFVIGGLVRALSILARLVGIGIGYLIMLLPEVAGYAVVGVCIGAVYLLVILLWFLWHNAKRSVPGEEAEGRMAIGEATGDGNANPHSSVSDPSSVLAAPTAVKATDKAAADPASTSPVAESISTSATAEIDGAEAINSEEVVFALLADDYGLARREAEVLPLPRPRPLRKGHRRSALRLGIHHPHPHPPHFGEDLPAFQAGTHRSR